MSVSVGTRLGPYEVVAPLGAGGMGEVYRARDTKLNRVVALKVLPEAFVLDPERLARFKREAQILASLNHPSIAAIYGLEESNGVQALVLELVEGPTLLDRIARGPIPLDDALPIAKQIAEALEAAHEQGIIHRDLKPANIKVRHDGMVKVLDFGLAKALAPEASGIAAGELSRSPTITGPAATSVGVLLGTAAYMSPEQARGQRIDKRTDVWAFACVLYELLTGQPAFSGRDVSEVLAAVIKSEPAWAALPSATPLTLRSLLRRCLQKDPRQRLHDIADARIEIDEASAAPAHEPGEIARVVLPSTWRRVATHVSTALVGSAVGGAVVWLTLRPVLPPLAVSRFNITPPSAARLTISGSDRDLAITRDGTHVIYTGDNGSALLVWALDQLEATRLTGLGAPRGPFVSPDGQWIGFSDGGMVLKKVALSGGPAVVLIPRVPGLSGASWGPDNAIVFATDDPSTGLQRIPAEGGAPTVLTRPNRAGGEADHLWPEFLPDGQAVLFTITAITGSPDAASVAVLDLRSGAQTTLIRGGRHAQYVRSGHLVYGVAGTLRAVPFDLTNRAVIGVPVPVVPEVVTSVDGATDAAVADDGTLVYVPGAGVAPERTLVWVDRQGREEPLKAPARAYQYPQISPDGRRVALDVRDQERDLWIWDFIRDPARVTFDSGLDEFPVWTPDGLGLVFCSTRAGAWNLFRQAVDGTGAVERLSESPNTQAPKAISPDATRIVFVEEFPKTGSDLMMLTLDKQRQAEPLVRTPSDELNAEISPDGRWLAYQSNESGSNEVYVRPFPDVNNGRWQISTGGGQQPLWARSGEELFYRAPNGALVSRRIERATKFTPGAVTKLFEGRYYVGGSGRNYDVSLDGQRFLMIKPGGDSDQAVVSPTFIVVQNWFEELKRLAPAK